MSDTPAEHVWQAARLGDVRTVMSWFGSEAEAKTWGGPQLRFPFSEPRFLEDIGWEEVASLCLRASGSTLAFGQVYLRDGRGHLARLAVAPACRGQGHGHDLLARLRDFARQKFGCQEFSLFVLNTNAAARRLYERHGFVETSNRTPGPLGEMCLMIARDEGEPTG